jgi:hypothetical protein
MAKLQASNPAVPSIIRDGVEQHTLLHSLLLHLAPGVVITLAYILLTPPLLALGVPNLLTLNLVAIFVLVPIELGILFRAGKLKTGRWTLQGVVLYSERLPLWQILVLALGLLVWSVLCFLIVSPVVDPLLQKALFSWLPDWFPLSTNFAAYPRSIVLITLLASLVCTSWVAPVVEEYYFRGYLLPRISRFGAWAAPINAVLFTLYHFFTPWQAITRILAITPLAWVVQRKRNIFIGILTHLALNTISLLPGLLSL